MSNWESFALGLFVASIFWLVILAITTGGAASHADLKDRFMEKCITQGAPYRECLEIVGPRK